MGKFDKICKAKSQKVICNNIIFQGRFGNTSIKKCLSRIRKGGTPCVILTGIHGKAGESLKGIAGLILGNIECKVK